MAGTNPGFNAAAFRTAIIDAMTMGLPSETQDRATFRWNKERTFNTVDPAGTPYDLTAAPLTDTTPDDVLIPCAVEFSARPAGSLDTTVGEFDTSRVVITVLDEHYPQVEGADGVLLGQNTYEIQFVAPPIGLFEVTVYQVYAVARDES